MSISSTTSPHQAAAHMTTRNGIGSKSPYQVHHQMNGMNGSSSSSSSSSTATSSAAHHKSLLHSHHHTIHHVQHHPPPPASQIGQRASLEIIDLNRSNLSSELSHVKESDILNDEEASMNSSGPFCSVDEVGRSSAVAATIGHDEPFAHIHHGHKLAQASARSASVSLYSKSGNDPCSKLAAKNASLAIKKRNSSSPSSNSISFDNQLNPYVVAFNYHTFFTYLLI